MTESWRHRVRELIDQRTEVQEATLEESFRHIRTAVPGLTVGKSGTPGAHLEWSREPERLSLPLGSLFWDFVALADASDEAIIAVAEGFGPLRWPEPAPLEADKPDPAMPIRADDDAWERLEPGTEPVRLWRMYARGLAALYDLLDPALPAQASRPDIKTWSVAPAAIPVWMADPDPDAPALEEGWLINFVMTRMLGVDNVSPAIAWSERLMVAALAAAGVDPAYPAHPTSKLVYTLPARPVPVHDRPTAILWQVKGLLPILMTSLAFAVRTQERPRCTRCGRPAAIITRGPRAGRAWYGDHAVCRALARAETMVQAEEKRSERRQAQSANLALSTSTAESEE